MEISPQLRSLGGSGEKGCVSFTRRSEANSSAACANSSARVVPTKDSPSASIEFSSWSQGSIAAAQWCRLRPYQTPDRTIYSRDGRPSPMEGSQ